MTQLTLQSSHHGVIIWGIVSCDPTNLKTNTEMILDSSLLQEYFKPYLLSNVETISNKKETMSQMLSMMSAWNMVKSNQVWLQSEKVLHPCWCVFRNRLNPVCSDSHEWSQVWIWPHVSCEGNPSNRTLWFVLAILLFFKKNLRPSFLPEFDLSVPSNSCQYDCELYFF